MELQKIKLPAKVPLLLSSSERLDPEYFARL